MDQRARDRNRIYWSGPNKLERKIVKAFHVKPSDIGLAPRSVLKTMKRRKR